MARTFLTILSFSLKKLTALDYPGLCLTILVNAIQVLWYARSPIILFLHHIPFLCLIVRSRRAMTHRVLLTLTALLFISSTGFFISKVAEALTSLKFAIHPSSTAGESATEIFTATNQEIHRAELAVTVFQEMNVRCTHCKHLSSN